MHGKNCNLSIRAQKTPPDYITRNIVISSDGVFCALIDKKGDDKKYTFSGKRIHRGLYRSKNGTLLNADINGASNILRKEYPNAFDGIKDFTYLYVTTISIDYKDLYKNAKTCVGRPKSYKYHKSGRYTAVRHMKRSHKKCEYNKLWGKGKSVWTPDKNKQDMQQEKTA